AETERDASGQEARRIAPCESGELRGEVFDVVLAQASGKALHELGQAASVARHRAVGRFEIRGGRLERRRDLVRAIGGLSLGFIEGLFPAVFRRLRGVGGETGRFALRSLDLPLDVGIVWCRRHGSCPSCRSTWAGQDAIAMPRI